MTELEWFLHKILLNLKFPFLFHLLLKSYIICEHYLISHKLLRIANVSIIYGLSPAELKTVISNINSSKSLILKIPSKIPKNVYIKTMTNHSSVSVSINDIQINCFLRRNKYYETEKIRKNFMNHDKVQNLLTFAKIFD